MKRLIFLIAAFFFGMNAYAANGDLIVNGNLGVGTQSPTSKAEITGNTKVNGNVQISGTGNGIIFPDGTTQTSAAAASGGNGDFIVNGKLGIGTSTPSNKLHLYGGNIYVENADTWQTALVLYNNSVSKSFQFLVGGSGNTAVGVGGFGIYDSVGGFRFNINSNGNVGIGTATPQAKLDVAGNVKIGGHVSATAAAIYSNSTTATVNCYGAGVTTSVSCPANTEMVAGGASCSAASIDDSILKKNYPSGTNSWTATCIQAYCGSISLTVTAYVKCL